MALKHYQTLIRQANECMNEWMDAQRHMATHRPFSAINMYKIMVLSAN